MVKQQNNDSYKKHFWEGKRESTRPSPMNKISNILIWKGRKTTYIVRYLKF